MTNFCMTFSSINKSLSVVQKYLAGQCLFVIIPLSHGRDDSVDQSTDAVCGSNLPGPFHALSTPTEEYCETSMARYGSVRLGTARHGSARLGTARYGSARLSPGHAHFWGW